MKVKLYIDPQTAILSGKSVIGMTTIDFDPSTLTMPQRETLAILWETQAQAAILPVGDYKIADASPESVAVALDQVSEATQCRKRESDEWAAQKESEAKIQEEKYLQHAENEVKYFVAETTKYLHEAVCVDRYSRPERPPVWNEYSQHWAKYKDEATQNLERQAREKYEMLLNAWKKEEEDKAAAERQEKEKEKVAKKALIASWVEKNGTENQKARLSANLLPQKEILGLIKTEIAGELTRYELISDSDIDHDEDRCCPHDAKMECDIADLTSVSADQWDTMESVRAHLSAQSDLQIIELTPRQHICECACCKKTKSRYGIYVVFNIRGVKLSVEFACPK